jgi:hypothetical protein
MGLGEMDERSRGDLWGALGASADERAELCAYARNAFDFSRVPETWPVPDEPFVETWQSYVAAARSVGVLPCLRERLVQLRFPVRQGISDTESYRLATRRGLVPDADAAEKVELVSPAGLRLWVQPTPAGCIPVIVADARADFELLFQALTRRNEPRAVPASMGACIVSGYNNWDRIGQLKRRWEQAPPAERACADWDSAFAEIVRQPSLYQDRFVLLSSGPYSGVAAAELGLAEEDWNRRSLTIRLEHECTHYFTRQVLGSMRNALADELVADYMGIVASEGRYRADWFLRFVGLEGSGYRPGGRLENYRGNPPLSDGAFAVLQAAVRRAAENLERLDQRRRGGRWSDADKARTIIALSRPGLEGLVVRSDRRGEAFFTERANASANPV